MHLYLPYGTGSGGGCVGVVVVFVTASLLASSPRSRLMWLWLNHKDSVVVAIAILAILGCQRTDQRRVGKTGHGILSVAGAAAWQPYNRMGP